MTLRTLIKQDRTFHQPVNWGVTSVMITLHLGALGALFFFTWKALILGLFMWWVAGSLGIGMGYHRLLTHRGYKTPKFVEYIFPGLALNEAISLAGIEPLHCSLFFHCVSYSLFKLFAAARLPPAVKQKRPRV